MTPEEIKRYLALPEKFRDSRLAHTLGGWQMFDNDGRWSGVLNTVDAALSEPLGWKKPRRIFVNSMSDLFWGTDKDLYEAARRGVVNPQQVPFDFIDKVFAMMALCPQHTFQVLTKRPERMAEYFASRTWGEVIVAIRDLDYHMNGPKWVKQFIGRYQIDDHFAGHRVGTLSGEPFAPAQPERMPQAWPLPNVWLGTSVENQQTADERIPHLLRCPAAVRFVSYEPALGPVDFRKIGKAGRGNDIDALNGQVTKYRQYKARNDSECSIGVSVQCWPPESNKLDWIIVGGESGKGARPFDIAWARSAIEQCKAADVSVFCKQIGSVAAKAIGSDDPKGGCMADWPQDIQIREFPNAV